MFSNKRVLFSTADAASCESHRRSFYHHLSEQRGELLSDWPLSHLPFNSPFVSSLSLFPLWGGPVAIFIHHHFPAAGRITVLRPDMDGWIMRNWSDNFAASHGMTLTTLCIQTPVTERNWLIIFLRSLREERHWSRISRIEISWRRWSVTLCPILWDFLKGYIILKQGLFESQLHTRWCSHAFVDRDDGGDVRQQFPVLGIAFSSLWWFRGFYHDGVYEAMLVSITFQGCYGGTSAWSTSPLHVSIAGHARLCSILEAG